MPLLQTDIANKLIWLMKHYVGNCPALVKRKDSIFQHENAKTYFTKQNQEKPRSLGRHVLPHPL